MRGRDVKVEKWERGIRNVILSKAKALRDCSAFDKVFVTPDRPPSQRKLCKLMRLELKRREEADEVVFKERISNERVFLLPSVLTANENRAFSKLDVKASNASKNVHVFGATETCLTSLTSRDCWH